MQRSMGFGYAMRDDHALSPALTLLMAVACGAIVAKFYHAQTLSRTIGPDIGLSAALAGES